MATEIYLGRPPENIVNWIKAERKYQLPDTQSAGYRNKQDIAHSLPEVQPHQYEKTISKGQQIP